MGMADRVSLPGMLAKGHIQDRVTLVECPRDAMQGMHGFIPTDVKVAYLNALLEVGFDVLDFGSFVSPKAIPQMADTATVLSHLHLNVDTDMLAIIANVRGAEDAIQHPEIQYLGYPFSISETFQLRNTNATILESLDRIKAIQAIAESGSKEVVTYISMGFGNPYGDPWNADIVMTWVDRLAALGIKIFALSDTIGVSTPDNIHYLFSELIPSRPDLVFGAHLHTHPSTWEEKMAAALASGCRRFDGALKGFGGCPMAKDDLTGNMPMEHIIQYIHQEGYRTNIDLDKLHVAIGMVDEVFSYGKKS